MNVSSSSLPSRFTASLQLSSPYQPAPAAAGPDAYSVTVRRVAKHLFHEYKSRHQGHHKHKQSDQEDEDMDEGADDDEFDDNKAPLPQVRRLIRDLLTIRPPNPVEPAIQRDIDSILQYELKPRSLVDAFSIPRVTTDSSSAFSGMALWKGDITKLQADCIVNAANSQLLGCFQPDHLCIDNVIHAAAGPQLRMDCKAIRASQQDQEEPNGTAKVTRGYNLPAKFVLHTVGPALSDSQRQSGRASASQEEQLKSCYRNCLDLAAQLPVPVKSVAFCCISTGLFGFPQQRASEIAVATVSEWLQMHGPLAPPSQRSSIELVIFNVFKSDDAAIYEQLFQKLTGLPSIASSLSSSSAQKKSGLALAVEWLRNADSVLIAGGAGLSASAGLDYTSEEVFKKHFPVMHTKGFRCFYEFIGYRGWTPALQWGYLLSQINLARFNWPKSKVYAALKGIADHFQRRELESSGQPFPSDNKDADVNIRDPVDKAGYFVITTNADGMFGQNDFPLDRVFTTQGDYSRMQCLKPCRRDAVWSIRTNIDAALPFINPATQEIAEPTKIPKCPYCGGPVMMNVRGGNWFLEWPHAEQQKRYRQWLQHHLQRAAQRGKTVAILEIGVGFNTPSVVRFPMEELARSYGDACKLIRINSFRPEVPEEVDGESAIGLKEDAEVALTALQQALE